MKLFTTIIADLQAEYPNDPVNGPWVIGNDPPLTVCYNPNSQSLIAKLNAGVHITIYQDSWDGTVQIQDCLDKQLVSVGPYCLHVTTTINQERWFRQYIQCSWEWVTDCGKPTEKFLKAFTAMMNTLTPYLT